MGFGVFDIEAHDLSVLDLTIFFCHSMVWFPARASRVGNDIDAIIHMAAAFHGLVGVRRHPKASLRALSS
jgi:hypothetical protein